jgi:1-acyl-sn-glycerol-3-phosphate acyltransferase
MRPFLGQYALRIGCIPVNRGKRGAAVLKMKGCGRGAADPGQLIIYPQGTRVAPGDKKPYKVGTGLMYEQLGQPCVPVACQCGRVLAQARHPAQTGAGRGGVPARRSPPACRWPSSWPGWRPRSKASRTA